MAVGVTLLENGSGSGSGPFSGGTLSPGATDVLVLFVQCYNATGQTSVTGFGLTWEKIASCDGCVSNPTSSYSVWRAHGAATSGNITITGGGGSGTTGWLLFAFSGADQSGTNGSGAIRQVNTLAGVSNPSITLGALQSSSSRAVGWIFKSASVGSNPNPGSGYTDIGNNPTVQYTEWKLNSTVVDWSLSSTRNVMVAFEVVAWEGAQVTQEYVEVLSSGPGVTEVTQEYVEVLSSAESPHTRVTQEYVEILSSEGGPDSRITPTFTGREPKIELGCGSYRALLTERGGGNPIALLPFNQLSWNRQVDGVSSASLTVPMTSQDVYDACCAILQRADSYDGEVDPWAHEISIYRDDVLVWCGPITGMQGNFEELSFQCRDLFAHFEKRWLPVTRDVITDIAELFNTFAHDAYDQDTSPNIEFVGYAINMVNRRTVIAEDFVKASAFLSELGQDGLDFTMVGRKLYFGNLDNLARDMDVSLALPRFAVADGSWEKRGSVQATEQTVMGQPPGGAEHTIYATATAEEALLRKYGLLQESATESFITVQAFLKNAARSRLEMVKTPPKFLDLTLDPKAPFTIDQLFAGFLCTVGFDIGCFRANEEMRIHEVSVGFSVDEEGEEKETVQVTVVPKGQPDFGFGFDTGLGEL